MKKYSGIIFKTSKNEFILQRRETKKGIDNSGLITIFGGVLENNETHLDCISREIKEELNYNLKNEEITHFVDYDKVGKINNLIVSRFYVYNLPVSLKDLTLLEGERIETISIKNYFEQNNEVSPVTDLILSKYIKKYG